MLKKLLLISFTVLLCLNISAQTGWQAVTGFGTNPGNLNMYSYTPIGITGKVPLVVAMHGCTENAPTFAAQSGWDKLADNHKFYVIYPEQNSANNSSTCFNWFQPGDQNRDQGEAYSIKQMIDYMKTHYSIDTTQIFATGLSAGACMTSVMLACYPDVFSAGAIMAGAAFKAANNSTNAVYAMDGLVTYSPIVWGDSVRAEFPSYIGPYPRVAVYQGSADYVVSPANETEIMKQWTNVHGADQTADAVINSFNGNSLVTKNIYNDNNGNEVVETYTISGMPHGIALDTGSCYQQGGQTGTYAIQEKLFSSFWAAYFFNILHNTITSINGLQTVFTNQTGVSYSVTSTANTTYTWTAPSGASITSGQGTNQVTVDFGSTSGNISVTETSSTCKIGPFNLFVNVSSSTDINQVTGMNDQITVYPNPGKGIIHIQSENTLQVIKLMNPLGEIVYSKETDAKENNIDVSLFSAGIYILSLQEAGKSAFIRKLILQ